MMRELNRSDVPPKKSDVLWVECVKGLERQKFLVYSPAIMGCYQHWTGKRTVPCFTNHDLCPGGHKEATKKWRGYVHAWSYKRNQQVICQLTGDAIESWWAQLSSGVSLRGQTIYVVRSTKDNGRLFVEVDKIFHRDADKIAQAVDPVASLWNMWKMEPSHAELNASLATETEHLPKLAECG
jgi:hypothetical protein